jgi:hypothetical protein
MLIGTTVIGLELMMRLIRLAQKKAEEHNENIYKINVFASTDNGKDKREEYDNKIINTQGKFEKDKEKLISKMAHEQANNNVITAKLQAAEAARSFAIREAQRLAANKFVGI